MKQNKMVKSITAFTSVLLSVIILFYEPVTAYAMQYGTKTLELYKHVQLDAAHDIDIYATVYIEYEWEEGVNSWITKGTIEGGVGSNTVNVETVAFSGESNPDASMYRETYYFYGHHMLKDYRGTIEVYATCDEWGDVEGGITYKAR